MVYVYVYIYIYILATCPWSPSAHSLRLHLTRSLPIYIACLYIRRPDVYRKPANRLDAISGRSAGSLTSQYDSTIKLP